MKSKRLKRIEIVETFNYNRLIHTNQNQIFKEPSKSLKARLKIIFLLLMKKLLE